MTLQDPPAGHPALSHSDIDAIRAFLSPELDQLEEGLGTAACRYVLEGGSDSVLLRIENAPGTRPEAHGSVLTLLGIRWSLRADRVFLTPESWDPETIRRLGEVLARVAQCSGRIGSLPGSATIPAFFRALLLPSAELAPNPSPTQSSVSWLLTGPRCLELLALAQSDQAALVEGLFSQLAPGAHNGRRRLLAMSALAEALQSAPERTLHGARALDEAGQGSFIAYLGQQRLSACPVFLDYLLDVLAHGSTLAGSWAATALRAAPAPQRLEGAARLLKSPDPARRHAAIRVLISVGTPDAHELLAAHAPTEKSAELRRRIQPALRLLGILAAGPDAAREDSPQGYVALGGQWIALPSEPSAPEDTPLPPDFEATLRAALTQAHEAAHPPLHPPDTEGPSGPPDPPFWLEALPQLIQVLAGRLPAGQASAEARYLLGGAYHAWPEIHEEYLRTLATALSQPGITPYHLARALALQRGPHTPWSTMLLNREVGSLPAERLRAHARAQGDLRPVLTACATVGAGPARLVSELLSSLYGSWKQVLPHGMAPLLWTFVGAHLDLIDEALGLAPLLPGRGYSAVAALELLSVLPAVPRRHLPILLDLALRGGKQEKPLARALLTHLPEIRLITLFLEHSDPSLRQAAAQWLAERGERSALPDLREALAREKTEHIRAAFLAALVALGDDISTQLSEEQQLQEALRGLASTRSHVEDCVPLAHLPPLQWADGRPVPTEIVRWWVVLAHKNKSARGDPLLTLALQRICPDSGHRLGLLMLTSFLTYDTRHPSEEEANAYAHAETNSRLQSHKGQAPDRAKLFEQLRSEKLAEYTQSAHAHRGLLALTGRIKPFQAVSLIQTYFREHPDRVVASKDLLDALAQTASPPAIQLIFEVSSQHPLKPLRTHATRVLQRIAEGHHWTLEELGDRTIPTAGLDERGERHLTPGGYVARLDADLKLSLRNPRGQPVKALPAGGEFSAPRAALNELKRQLREIAPPQTRRLYEAMCLERTWQPEAFELLLRHPIVGRLCQRLIFLAQEPEGGQSTFRPLGDGSLSDAHDGPVDLHSVTRIRIAHRSLLEEPQVLLWKQHLQDYRITPLFDLLDRPVLTASPGQASSHLLGECEGHLIDTPTLQTLATRLGYQPVTDTQARWLKSYEKGLVSASLSVILDITACPVDTPVCCALIGLRFRRSDASASGDLSLSEVPPVLLSESWNDLREIAAGGSGFDPAWRGKTQHNT